MESSGRRIWSWNGQWRSLKYLSGVQKITEQFRSFADANGGGGGGNGGATISPLVLFDVSSASTSGAIVPATTTRNISQEHNHNSTHLNRSRNRRILCGLPIPHPESPHNVSSRHTRRNSQKNILNGDNPISPMVVSVLVDPREVGGDADVESVMGPKSLSRIFVVVLVYSVKYVTYSCMLPFKGSTQHLVAA
ncbi:hypothetical protein CASFOL_009002 [Castilleja foliolosa]|uniref:Uncharacterized protein n=1 Tax=Castilleja foliolosa TaxID=1961234 RepID=A0ABD3E4N5_9LAMI